MSSDAGDPEQMLKRFREYLSLLARLLLDLRLQGIVDLSGVVQQTLLEAHQAIGYLRAMSETQQAGWLRKAPANNLTDEVRKLMAAARDVRRERSLEVELEKSFGRQPRSRRGENGNIQSGEARRTPNFPRVQ